ncbi:MAG: CsgG/HfaB family protein [Vibrio toranzoniae]|mgnify:FL=1|jgi:curli production assembly/transport component CsgG|uniref:Curli production assembly/transport component CsgG n=1 Tax=Vibrio toranzoniae TaxID=1194427 RepID=A0A109DAW3_9VIBR|nr:MULTISPECIES: CsgG/HfaB family protein [Vibrio]KWU02068.1 curli production assembly/transport protein CsgG [Vibrio toranzoniae]MDA0144603.1 curli production assembly/transport protein CsgG [Vibrio sp. RW]NAZ47756.1 curli production assembly/transport protein CsgG [Vibrio toranzoniae]NAZ55225.1 curli production assembly/transport protein CsgG [Vibrio toranzoniae]NAZ70300.1 curli production assembly/transport protein CsgG [Vibrio toranzoniae]
MKSIAIVFLAFVLGGCTYSMQIPETSETPKLMPRGSTYTDLISLPQPRGKILVSVYDFRDQTGQYKPQPNSNFSTAVPQGGTSLLTTSLIDSQWFVPLEREGLQNLLTERKIIRAAQKKDKVVNNHGADLTSLSSANIVIEGGIVAYDSNIVTGGAGAKYLGIGGSGQYRTDQVTVNLRAVDVRTGQVLLSVTTTKTISSHEIGFGAFRFVDYKELLEVEMGYSQNEPVNIAVMSAIDAAVIHLIVKGMKRGMWSPGDPNALENPIIARYSEASTDIL